MGHCGPMSVGALTTALAFAPESMQASSSPEQLRLLFRVRIKVSFLFDKEFIDSSWLCCPNLCTSVFSMFAFMIKFHLQMFFRM